jgi:hypothetical protein
VTSCATGPWLEDVDRWEEAHAVCGEASEACTSRLREDFGIGDFDRVEYLLESFRFLVVWDLGEWPPVEAAYVHAESVAPFADCPGASTTAKVYNYATAAVDAVFLDNERTVSRGHFAVYNDGRVYVSSALTSFAPGSVAPTLVHEAAHATWQGHDDCDGVESSCDRTWAGAFGSEAAVAWLAAERAEGMDERALRGAAEGAARRVVIE